MSKKSIFIIGCICLLFLVIITGIIFNVQNNQIILTFNFSINNNQKYVKMNKGASIDLKKYNQNFEGYEFIGWFNDVNLSYEISDEYIFTSNNTIYAGYSKILNINDIKDINNENIYSYTIVSNDSDIITNEQIKKLINSGVKRLDLSKCKIKNNKLDIDLFKDCYINELLLPNNISDLNSYTFYNCLNIEKIYLPDNLEILRSNTFYNCPNLKEIIFNNKILKLEKDSIVNCDNLKNITLPYSIIEIESNFISNCKNLENINIENNEFYQSINGVLFTKDLKVLLKFPQNKNIDYTIENIDYISNYAFNNSNIKNIYIKGDLKEIGKSAFDGCEKIKTVNIENSYDLNLKDSCFRNCKNLINIEFSNNIKNIEDYAFKNCINLKNINITGTEKLGNSVFEECLNLREIILSNTINEIGKNLFYNCISLKTVNINSNINTLKENMFYNCKNLEHININVLTIENIENNIFYNCIKLKYLNNLNNVKKLGNNVFYNCQNLLSLDLSKVENINEYTIYNCYNLNELNLLSLNSLNKNTLINCNNLFNLTLGQNLKYIEDGSIINCNRLYLNLLNNSNFINKDGMIISKNYEILHWYNKTNNENITIPNSIKFIYNYAFSGKDNLKEINVENNNLNFISTNGLLLNKNNNYLISYPSGRQTSVLNLGNDINGLNKYSIQSKYLNEIIINDSVSYIENGSIFNTNINKLTLPFLGSDIKINNNDYIGYIFSDDINQNNITYLINKNLPNNLKYINLTKQTTICDYSFYNCFNIEYITIENSCNEINDYAFYGCDNLIEINMKGEVNFIGKEAFKKCISLSNISLGYNRNLTIGSNAFKDVIKKIYIYVYYNVNNRPDITAQTNYRNKFINIYNNSRNWVFRYYETGV